MDTEPHAVPQGTDDRSRVSSGVRGEGGSHEVIQYDVDDVDGDHDEALYAAYVEDDHAERSFQRDMSDARAALRRGSLVMKAAIRSVKSRRERRSRATRSARVAAPSSGDSSPPEPPPSRSWVARSADHCLPMGGA